MQFRQFSSGCDDKKRQLFCKLLFRRAVLGAFECFGITPASSCVIPGLSMLSGDGVNDAPALSAAQCGIAVEDATDAAKNAAAACLLYQERLCLK